MMEFMKAMILKFIPRKSKGGSSMPSKKKKVVKKAKGKARKK